MDPDRWARVKSIVDAALDLPSDAREAFVVTACDGDDLLRGEVEDLLAGESQAKLLFDEPLVSSADAPQRAGAYRLVKKVGHGGMGAIFLAEREDAEFHRTVAVKLLQRGAESADLIRRFRAERQILASVDHPYVAELYDGGTTEDGRPFLVMEYIDGLPLDVYCRTNRLDTRRRLELFAKVCAAVHVAHQHLVVHRDLKPGNVLVTADENPKLLDFGIAKLLAPERSTGTIGHTRVGLRLMTPEYASPEQASGLPVTTASDVYSLGVVLYELLTDRRPYELDRSSESEMARWIRTVVPPRPSEVVTSEAAAVRGVSRERLRRTLRGDLDNIVAMAMRKEPDRRYRSVEELSRDVRRHLDRVPVIARPDALAYRAVRFVQRHAAGLAVASLLSVVVLGLLGVSLHERARAEAEAAKAHAVSDLLQEMVREANPRRGGENDLSVLEALTRAVEGSEETLAGQPELEGIVRSTAGGLLNVLGRSDASQRELERALEIQEGALGDDHPDLALTLYRLGIVRFNQGHYDAALSLLERAAEIQRLAFSPHDLALARSLHVLGAVYQELGDLDAAERRYGETLAIRERALGDDDRETLRTMVDFALLSEDRGDYQTAESLYRRNIGIQRRTGAQELEDSLDFLGRLLTRQGRHDEATDVLTEARDLIKVRYGARSPAMARNTQFRAELAHAKGAHHEARRLYEVSIAMLLELFGPANVSAARARLGYFECLLEGGHFDEAEAQLVAADAVLRDQLGAESKEALLAASERARLDEARNAGPR